MTAEIYDLEPFKRSRPTQILVEQLRGVPEDGLITYQTLSDAINQDVQYKGRYHLSSAVDIVRREYDIVLKCERGIGYRRLKNGDISSVTTKEHQARLKRDTQLFRSKIECVDVQSLDSQERLDHTLAATYISLRERITDKKTDRALKGAIAKKETWLPDKDAFVAAFGDKG